jgi:hypothetical protein
MPAYAGSRQLGRYCGSDKPSALRQGPLFEAAQWPSLSTATTQFAVRPTSGARSGRARVEAGPKDVGEMRGWLPHSRICVRGFPCLTSGVNFVGHKPSDGSSPAVGPAPPVREVRDFLARSSKAVSGP